MDTDEHLRTEVHRLAGLCAGICAFAGLAVLVGWIGDLNALKEVIPGHVSMKANTAIGFVLVGIALWLLRDEKVPGRAQRLGQSLGAFVSAFAALTLFEYILGANLGIDGLFEDDSALTSHPGRAGPHTALALFSIGLWLACLPLDGRWGRRVCNSVAAVACVVVFQSVVGFLFEVDYLYGIKSVTGMALHTMLGGVVACVGISAARPTRGLMGILTSPGAGGHMARRIAPAVVGLPLIIAYLRVLGQDQGWFGTRDGVAILAGTTVVLIGAIALITARSLERTDDERRLLADRLEDLADRDPLTGLFNRRGFDKEMSRHLALARRYGNRVALIAIDLDHLKSVNDAHGHAVGDELLMVLAKRWQSAVRVTDPLARIGGDEFVVLLPQADPAGSEEIVATKLVEVARQTIVGDDTSPVNTTISVGVALADSEPFDGALLLLAADKALYEAKSAGGNRYELAAPTPKPTPGPTGEQSSVRASA